MPNYCSNKIVVCGDLNKFKTWLNGEPFSLNKIAPMDQTLLDGEGWYDWRLANWGVKWELNFEEIDQIEFHNNIILKFDTAWCPPRIAIGKLAKLFPEINIAHAYRERGRDIVGKDHYRNGKKIKTIGYYRGHSQRMQRAYLCAIAA